MNKLLQRSLAIVFLLMVLGGCKKTKEHTRYIKSIEEVRDQQVTRYSFDYYGDYKLKTFHYNNTYTGDYTTYNYSYNSNIVTVNYNDNSGNYSWSYPVNEIGLETDFGDYYVFNSSGQILSENFGTNYASYGWENDNLMFIQVSDSVTTSRADFEYYNVGQRGKQGSLPAYLSLRFDCPSAIIYPYFLSSLGIPSRSLVKSITNSFTSSQPVQLLFQKETFSYKLDEQGYVITEKAQTDNAIATTRSYTYE